MIKTSITENDGKTIDNSVEMSVSEINTSCPRCSQSSVSIESDLSFLLSNEQELDPLVIGDELPAFEIRLMSPLGRIPSPIGSNAEDLQTPTRLSQLDDDSTPSACQNSDFVALKEIDAMISPSADNVERKEIRSRCNSLETIFEDVFLNTPPKNASNIRKVNATRSNMFEKKFISEANSGKENQIANGIDSIKPSRNYLQPKEHIPDSNVK